MANKISIAKKKDFEKTEELVKPWYPKEEKIRNSKLGTIYNCKFQGQDTYVCRLMKFDRISSYQVEGYFASIGKLQYL